MGAVHQHEHRDVHRHQRHDEPTQHRRGIAAYREGPSCTCDQGNRTAPEQQRHHDRGPRLTRRGEEVPTAHGDRVEHPRKPQGQVRRAHHEPRHTRAQRAERRAQGGSEAQPVVVGVKPRVHRRHGQHDEGRHEHEGEPGHREVHRRVGPQGRGVGAEVGGRREAEPPGHATALGREVKPEVEAQEHRRQRPGRDAAVREVVGEPPETSRAPHVGTAGADAPSTVTGRSWATHWA